MDNFNIEDFDCYNYLLTNFEPWKVEEMMKKFKNSIIFGDALNCANLSCEREKFIQVCKIKDL